MNTNDIATPPRKSVRKPHELPLNALAMIGYHAVGSERSKHLSYEAALMIGSEVLESEWRKAEKVDLDVNEHNATANEAEDQVSEQIVAKTPKVHKQRRITGIKQATPLLSKIPEVAVENTESSVKRKLFQE